MKRLFKFILGTVEVSVQNSINTSLIQELQSVGIYSLISNDEFYLFKCDLKRLSDVKSVLDKYDVDYNYTVYSFTTLVTNIKKRLGIAVAIMIVLITDCFLSGMIWRIDVPSANGERCREIKNNLASLGVYEGARIDDIDIKQLYIDYMLKDKNVSWAHLNLNGTTAVFDFSKRELPQKNNPDKIEISNIVSSCDGVVERIDVYSGGREVNAGESVSKDQLLISSFFETRVSGYILRRAKGNVVAYTEPVFEMLIPKKMSIQKEIKMYEQKALNILSYIVPLKIAYKNENSVYLSPKIDNENICILSMLHTPFFIRKDTISEIITDKKIRTLEECKSIYQQKLGKKIEELRKTKEIINFKTSNSENDDYYIFKTTFSCKESIGVEKTVDVTKNNIGNT